MITRSETVDLISAIGAHVTVLVEGDIGSGKSALLHDIAKRYPTHRPVYMDMSVMHEGDFRIPAVDHDTKTSTFYPNKSLGLHGDSPVILMMDEIGKASKQVKDASLPLLVERRLGGDRLPEGSIVFATTNIGAEGVGDVLQAHHYNRLTIVRMAKPTAQEWIDDYAKLNGIAPEIIMFAGERPEILASFEEYPKAADNPYIFHPREPRRAFVTHRSLAQASVLVSNRGLMSLNALQVGLAGTIGEPAALDLMAWVRMGDSLPRRSEILTDPANAKLPDQVGAQTMLVYQALNWVKEETLDAWMTYLMRLPKTLQAMFIATLVRKPNCAFALRNTRVTVWASQNSFLFT